MSKISDIWNWSIDGLSSNLIDFEWFNGKKIKQNNLIKDYSSYLFGNGIIKQKRVKEGNCFSSSFHGIWCHLNTNRFI